MSISMRYLQGTIAIYLMLPVNISMACERGYQEWKSTSGNIVCLPNKMASYLACIEASGGALVSVESSNASVGNKKVKVAVSGEGSGLIVKGRGGVEVDTANEAQAVGVLKKNYHLKNPEICEKMAAEGAVSQQSNSAQRKRSDLGTITPNNSRNTTKQAESPPASSPTAFQKFELVQPKPTDCHNATFKLRDAASNREYEIVLRDNEQINACSINFTASDDVVAESVARFVGLIGGGRYAFISAVGSCESRKFIIVDKKTGKKYEDFLPNNCAHFNFLRGPTQIAADIALYFNHN